MAISASPWDTAWNSRSGLPERVPPVGVRDRRVERRLRHPDRAGADARAEDVERAHRDLEAAVDLPEPGLVQHLDAVQLERPDRMGRDDRQRLTGKACRVALDDERRQPRAPAPDVVRAKTT